MIQAVQDGEFRATIVEERLLSNGLIRGRGRRELRTSASGVLTKNQRKLTSSLVLSAIILWKPIPTPSMTARKTPHIMAEFRAAL